ncbi:flagellar hook assembly protein FlgD [Rhizobiaceae bacterium BDR2-2]|uniref:Basal-body rod modification protein FlgD n=1 Tax=Ectorhizobium quercum TaxID=2965071 RepID=A0AAE3N142_9HYPH|nr:flagellar hook assembly protein FlgD [Ectorhizobium quercum]MCX8996128.1 flagellar hook assembly protein FlgD [Ectorhizobium quercum]MCX8998833.1 flagellar hook assembly protein FlgD [Ectorhizobium quercum]
MAVDSINSATATTTATATKASSSDAKTASLDYDSFLKLLLAQMKNQDPTDPMDASEQLSQLATFSQVEQSIKTNSHLENLITIGSLSNAASYIGKTITSVDGLTSGVIASVRVASDGVTATTTDGKEILVEEGIKISETET